MRAWLRGQYASLAALNAEWGSGFAHWEDVVPQGTDAAIARRDGNFASWNDFKAWMDVAFADALRAGTDAVHAADPTARAAIEGAQIPGWGGYDYTRLAGAVDVMEIYEAADNVGIVASLDPALVRLVSSGGGPAEAHDIWHAALLGARGVVLWDPDGAVVAADGTPGPRGIALAPVFAALHGDAGARLLASRPDYAAIGILYSPESERVRWLLDRRQDATRGLPNWTTRDAEAEWGDTAPRAARRHAVAALERAGLTPRFLAPAMLEHRRPGRIGAARAGAAAGAGAVGCGAGGDPRLCRPGRRGAGRRAARRLRRAWPRAAPHRPPTSACGWYRDWRRTRSRPRSPPPAWPRPGR